MSGVSEAEVILRGLGYRLTPQRLMIVEAVHSSDEHTSADDIFQKVQSLYPHINISTIYRTLDLLKELDLVTETDLGEGKVYYHWADKGRHHHLVCQSCGSLIALEDSVLDSLQETLREKHGFLANLSHLALFGVCGPCQAKDNGLNQEAKRRTS